MKTTFLYILLPLLLFGCAASPQINGNAPRTQVSLNDPDPLASTPLKSARDIEQRVAQIARNGGSESLAQAIAEIDEWLFAPEEEKQADQMLETLIGELRDRIEKGVALLLKAALDASNSNVATEKLSKVTSLLGLYPVPKTDEQRAKVDQIAASIRAASRQVEYKRRMSYNNWAISQMEIGLSEYYRIKKVFRTDENELIKACINSMKNIDPAFLEPAALDLYQYVFGLTRNAVNDKSRIALAKGFADPRTQRKTPIDF